MPSLAFLKSRAEVGESTASMSMEHDSTEKKMQRRQSKRDYFRNLLSLSSLSKSNKRKSTQLLTPQSSIVSPTSPPPPTSPMDKPLPPPPPAVAEAEEEPAPLPKTPLKLTRIISPISIPELHSIFSGAPQFFARSEGHNTGAPHPSVAFPWDTSVKIRDLSDHLYIQDEAWSCVTAWPHITYTVHKNSNGLKPQSKHRPHFLPRCRERPTMLSMQGKERGTTGYQAALEMGVADALEVPDEARQSEALSEDRKKFLSGKDGVRPITDSTLIECLLDISEVYHSDQSKDQRPTVQLYTELFTQILYPPSRVTDSDDPYSLQVQVQALISALAAPFVWIDFSLIEWRIRLGQILWGPSSETSHDEGVQESTDQKYWLLLQILLSCELLVRLDAISKNDARGVSSAEIERFEKDATTSVKWSLILARCWLKNIQIIVATPDLVEEKRSGWLATLTGSTGSDIPVVHGVGNLQFQGRHRVRQLDGLVHFARNIGWPDVDQLIAKISANGVNVSDTVQSSPSGTPMSLSTQHSSSYFSNRRPKIRRGLSSHGNVSALLQTDGWLSNSYLSGLILPGEGLSHFLISTLLENDSEAVSKLGEQANLYGGFVYGKKSFWSRSCVVGRILAAGKGASECMGWISSPVLPRGAGEGWVDLDVEYPILDSQYQAMILRYGMHDVLTEADVDPKTGKPRLWQKTAIEHDGNVIGGADASSVLPGDFLLPSDESVQPPLIVTFETLDLFVADDSSESSPGEDSATIQTERTETTRSIQTYSGMMRFSVKVDGEDKKEIDVAISHDVQFVTAHPCFSPPPSDIFKSPTSPSFQAPKTSILASSTVPHCHPLHKGFTWTTITLSTLMATPSSTPLALLLSASSSPPKTADTMSSAHTTTSNIPKALVVDCTDLTMVDFPKRPAASPDSGPRGHRFGSDLEVLARALCAERGWNVLISRRGRCCISCAIREAGALGWRVIIRVA